MTASTDHATSHAAAMVCCLTMLIALLCAAAVCDLRMRKIPNALSLAIAVLALPYGLAAGWSVFPDLVAHLATALALGGMLLCAFCLGMLGGGDVKMMAALGLWLSPGGAFDALVIMMIAGGLLGLTMARRYRHRLSRPSVPYGVAIAVAGASQALVPLVHLLP